MKKIQYTPLIIALNRLADRMGRGAWTEIGKKSGLSRPAVMKIAKEISRPKTDSWEKLNDAYPNDIPAPPWLSDDEELDEGNLKSVLLPVFDAGAGQPGAWSDGGYPVGNASSYFPAITEAVDANSFYVRIHGDSMEPALSEGDLALVVPSKPLQNGKLCFASFPGEDGERIVKRYQEQEGTIYLMSDNTKHKTIILTSENGEGVRIYRVEGYYRSE